MTMISKTIERLKNELVNQIDRIPLLLIIAQKHRETEEEQTREKLEKQLNLRIVFWMIMIPFLLRFFFIFVLLVACLSEKQHDWATNCYDDFAVDGDDDESVMVYSDEEWKRGKIKIERKFSEKWKSFFLSVVVLDPSCVFIENLTWIRWDENCWRRSW